jgi:hypothetical protein
MSRRTQPTFWTRSLAEKAVTLVTIGGRKRWLQAHSCLLI